MRLLKKNDKVQTKPIPNESWFLPVSRTNQWSITWRETLETNFSSYDMPSKSILEQYNLRFRLYHLLLRKSIYTYLQNKRMRRCGVPPPPTNNFRKT